MEACRAAALLALTLLATRAAAQPKSFPTLVDAGTREASHPAAGICTCVDKGINTGACVDAVQGYCTGTAPDAPKVCAYFRGLINDASREASMKAAAFLSETCAVKAPLGSNACACLEGLGTPGCRAAAINACVQGNSLCQATLFGAAAVPRSTVSLKDFVKSSCPKSPAISQALVNFAGMSVADYTTKLSAGVAAAIAKIGRVAASAVGAPTVTPSGKDVTVVYPITTTGADAPDVRERLAAAGTAGLVAALSAGTPAPSSFAIAGPPGSEVRHRLEFAVSKAEAAAAKAEGLPPPPPEATAAPVAAAAAPVAKEAPPAKDEEKKPTGPPPKLSGDETHMGPGATAGVVIGTVGGSAAVLGGIALTQRRNKAKKAGTAGADEDLAAEAAAAAAAGERSAAKVVTDPVARV